MTGLLFSAYEMNHFKDDYQRTVIANAKAFALALKEQGLDVAGDPDISFTETHQVILNVGYGKGSKNSQQNWKKIISSSITRQPRTKKALPHQEH